MNYILKPSLEHMALIKIVAALWNQSDVRDLMTKCSFPLHFIDKSEAWQNIEEKVIEKVPQLPLPEILKEKMLSFIKPIGLQIFKWIKHHCRGSYFLVDLPAELSWTPQGTINRKKTAEMLIKKESLDVCKSYKLACIYCLEEDIIKLWNKMPEHHRKTFLYQDFSNNAIQQHVVFLWTRDVKQEKWDAVDISYKTVFESCAFAGNKAAAEYFFQKLTLKVREESLINIANYVTDGDVLCFLLSQMKEEQQIEVFKSSPFTVLQSFLDWPLQGFFMDIAKHIWNFLSKEDFEHLLKMINQKIVYGYKDWNYKKLFMEFWQKSPSVLKNFNADESDKCLLLLLFQIKDKEIIKLIFQNVSLIEKKKLIYSTAMQYFCHRLIRDQEWHFLEFYIQQCLPSRDEMIKFKEYFEKHIMWHSMKGNLEMNKNKWNQLFHLPDNSVSKDKRCAENDEATTLFKRFRGLQECLKKC